MATITAHDSAPPAAEQAQPRPRVEPLVLAVGLFALGWGILFAWLAVSRHLSGGSHAEDLGFTDQVIANFLRGQWFRMSVYAGASAWNTEIDLSQVARPDSLLAFHVEPMLLLFVPLYALGGDVAWLLVVQAVAVGLGAIPAFVIGRRWTGSSYVGAALAGAYVFSPLGQWAVLSDFHTSTLAAPLLLLAVERLSARHARSGLVVAALALTAREDLGALMVGMGVVTAFGFKDWRPGAFLVGLGLAWTLVCLAVIRAYSGGVSPFAERYSSILANGPAAASTALTRPAHLEYLTTLLLGGGWLGVFAPLGLLPGLPSLALNLLSSSPWMASGRAHYSGLVLPFVAVAAAAALANPRVRRLRSLLAACLVASCGLAYLLAGAGPLAAEYAPATLTEHARLANAVAAGIPDAQGVSASASLVPHLSRRARVYVFPAVLDADVVLVDVTASPGPSSAGDMYLHLRDLLGAGGWSVGMARDGLLLLLRAPDAPPASLDSLPPEFLTFVRGVQPAPRTQPSPSAAGRVPPEPGPSPRLVSALLVPSPVGAIEPDGPRWVLRTSWVVDRQPPPGAGLEFALRLTDGETWRAWDLAPLWWYPPEHWTPGETVTIDVPNVPVRRFQSWQPVLSGFYDE